MNVDDAAGNNIHKLLVSDSLGPKWLEPVSKGVDSICKYYNFKLCQCPLPEEYGHQIRVIAIKIMNVIPVVIS